MTKSIDFQSYVSEVLGAFAKGEYDRTGLTECPFKGETESGIIRSLASVQDNLAVAAEQTQSTKL